MIYTFYGIEMSIVHRINEQTGMAMIQYNDERGRPIVREYPIGQLRSDNGIKDILNKEILKV